MYNRGYIANYDGVDVFLVSEEEYRNENPEILYIVMRPNEEHYLVLLNNVIVGYADHGFNVFFWPIGEEPNFDEAGLYNNLQDRETAYLKIEELV